ncbi:alpha/beta hydrolase [Cystobacter fuscus]
MSTPVPVHTAVNTPTRFAEVKGRRLAYRDIGQGVPILLCVRFRGILDSWDPAFLDALAVHHRVITFDYSGLGQSTGEPSYVRKKMAQDAIDLADALGLERFVIGGWSLGGIAAQVVARLLPERILKNVLIGTTPGQGSLRSEAHLLRARLETGERSGRRNRAVLPSGVAEVPRRGGGVAQPHRGAHHGPQPGDSDAHRLEDDGRDPGRGSLRR